MLGIGLLNYFTNPRTFAQRLNNFSISNECKILSGIEFNLTKKIPFAFI